MKKDIKQIIFSQLASCHSVSLERSLSLCSCNFLVSSICSFNSSTFLLFFSCRSKSPITPSLSLLRSIFCIWWTKKMTAAAKQNAPPKATFAPLEIMMLINSQNDVITYIQMYFWKCIVLPKRKLENSHHSKKCNVHHHHPWELSMWNSKTFFYPRTE